MKPLRSSAQFVALSAALALSACVGSGDKYPSLAVRDAERASGAFTPVVEAPTPPVADPALLAGLQAIEARARSSYDAFQSAIPAAETALSAARGANQSSNRWAAAQIALAELDSQRSQTAIALTDLDLIYAEASSELTMAQEIAELRAKVASFVRAQDQIMSALLEKGPR